MPTHMAPAHWLLESPGTLVVQASGFSYVHGPVQQRYGFEESQATEWPILSAILRRVGRERAGHLLGWLHVNIHLSRAARGRGGAPYNGGLSFFWLMRSK